MNLPGSCSFAVTDRPDGALGEPPAGPVVVWLQGEQDLSTDESLCRALAGAIALGSAELVLDLGEVAFLALSTLRVIVRARAAAPPPITVIDCAIGIASARRAMLRAAWTISSSQARRPRCRTA